MLLLQQISYAHPNKDRLFGHLDLAIVRHAKVALVGNNGTGKSTLLKIMAGVLEPSAGLVKTHSQPYYIPQLFGQFNHLTVAQALQVEEKLKAFYEILDGNVTETNLEVLNDDWTLEERCREALAIWNLEGLDLAQKMETLSGGQKTRVFLAGISIHQPEIVLLDEPSNHMDTAGRQLLYRFIKESMATLVVVSHDRRLLNLMPAVYELSKGGITVYGGNYEFYAEQKQLAGNALHHQVNNQEKALRKARETERATAERQQKLDARGRKKQEKAGLPTISLNTFKNNAEKSTSRLKGVHAEKVGAIAEQLQALRKDLPDADKMRFGFEQAGLPNGKILVAAKDINYRYSDKKLWETALNFQILSGERVALQGLNGSGKTTLIQLVLGALEPGTGILHRANSKAVYIDQDYSLINDGLKVYEQAQHYNQSGLQEHEIKIRLDRFLFPKTTWGKPCRALSGGEKMRLMLCCLTIGNQAPDLIVLDEPTNNLDLQNIGILTAAINEYQGTLLVVSHDAYFLEQVNVERTLTLS